MMEVFVGAMIMLVGVLIGFAISEYERNTTKATTTLIDTSNWPKETHGFGSGDEG